MSEIDERIAGFSVRQHGLVARWQALAAGVTPKHLQRRVEAGALVPVHLGVYRVRGVPFSQELRWMAGVLAAGPDAWLSHRAAAALHGFDVRRPRAEVTVAHERRCELDGFDLHRTRRRHDVTTVRRIPVTTPARTILDCASVLPYSVFDPMVQHAVANGLVRLPSLLAVLDRRGGRGVTGTVITRAVVRGGLVDDKIQRQLELIVARIIRRAAVPPPVRQHELVCSDGRRVVLDFAWPDRRLAVEAVGLRWHGDAARARHDRDRRRSILATGWTHVEYGWSEATEVPDVVLAEVESFWGGAAPAPGVDPPQNGLAAA